MGILNRIYAYFHTEISAARLTSHSFFFSPHSRKEFWTVSESRDSFSGNKINPILMQRIYNDLMDLK